MAKIPVTIYTTPNCVQCNQTKKLMDKLGIIYTTVDLTEHPEKLAEFKQQGLMAAPIVTTDVKVWSGFKYEKINSLATYIKSMERNV
jgi:glutaredoxin-like protein NrdH